MLTSRECSGFPRRSQPSPRQMVDGALSPRAPDESVIDPAAEWKRERLLALLPPISRSNPGPTASQASHSPDTAHRTEASAPDAEEDLEPSLLAAATESDAGRIERAVFDRSRAFGLRLARAHGRPLSPGELAAVLSGSSVPCLVGLWERRGSSAWILSRPGCDPACARHCDYWREAIDGLVMGAGDSARYARHRSRGHGDGECLDVLYAADEGDLRWGPVPDEVRRTLEPVSALLARSDIGLHLDGLSEGVLFYRLTSNGAAACGAGGALLKGVLEREVAARLPGMRVLDVTPMGVLKEE